MKSMKIQMDITDKAHRLTYEKLEEEASRFQNEPTEGDE